jgi:magnesium-transporting ATPase (P-type)
MSSAESQPAAAHQPKRPSLWLRELPFVALLVLTIVGVAYTSFSKRPLIVYWELLAPLIGVTCVAAGWASAGDRAQRSRLILTQTLHWLAFLVVMNLLLLSSVQRVFTANSTGLAVFTLLALGAFTAGVHVLSWQICLLGLIMALAIPVIAWIENSALIFMLVFAAACALAIAVVIFRSWHEGRRRSDSDKSD